MGTGIHPSQNNTGREGFCPGRRFTGPGSTRYIRRKSGDEGVQTHALFATNTAIYISSPVKATPPANGAASPRQQHRKPMLDRWSTARFQLFQQMSKKKREAYPNRQRRVAATVLPSKTRAVAPPLDLTCFTSLILRDSIGSNNTQLMAQWYRVPTPCQTQTNDYLPTFCITCADESSYPEDAHHLSTIDSTLPLHLSLPPPLGQRVACHGSALAPTLPLPPPAPPHHLHLLRHHPPPMSLVVDSTKNTMAVAQKVPEHGPVSSEAVAVEVAMATARHALPRFHELPRY